MMMSIVPGEFFKRKLFSVHRVITLWKLTGDSFKTVILFLPSNYLLQTWTIKCVIKISEKVLSLGSSNLVSCNRIMSKNWENL